MITMPHFDTSTIKKGGNKSKKNLLYTENHLTARNNYAIMTSKETKLNQASTESHP